MAANTIMIKIDTVEKETWDAILTIAGNVETLGELIDASPALLDLAENVNELLDLGSEPGPESPAS